MLRGRITLRVINTRVSSIAALIAGQLGAAMNFYRALFRFYVALKIPEVRCSRSRRDARGGGCPLNSRSPERPLKFRALKPTPRETVVNSRRGQKAFLPWPVLADLTTATICTVACKNVRTPSALTTELSGSKIVN